MNSMNTMLLKNILKCMKFPLWGFFILIAYNCFAKSVETNAALHWLEFQYPKLVSKLAPKNIEFTNISRTPVEITTIERSANSFGSVLEVEHEYYICIDCTTNRLLCFSNLRLYNFIQTNKVQTIPEWTAQRAIKIANEYLLILNETLNMRATLETITFGEAEYHSIWHIVWKPSDGGFLHDDFLKTIYNPRIEICLSEKYGFVLFTATPFPPPPRTTEVRISREDAIFKAEKAVPLVMLTPYYQQCRLPGFKASSVKSAELRIACPNWLLDPARAIWIWDSPPKETRLCWIVRFTTVDKIKRADGFKPHPPDILIYIDAATGEIVGANFT